MNDRISMAAYRRQKAAERPHASAWAEYEQRKQGWLRTHPEATHAEYEQAMRELAKRLGV